MACWHLGALLAAAVAVLLLSPDDALAQLKGNICEMDEARITELLECIMSKSPQGTLQLWESTKAMFGGRSPAQAVTALCNTSPAAGGTLISEFTNQQTKGDKPKFKKALKDCSS
ncbi:uncharacterized protein LOC144168493 [Haemaphysalis longicornis]